MWREQAYEWLAARNEGQFHALCAMRSFFRHRCLSIRSNVRRGGASEWCHAHTATNRLSSLICLSISRLAQRVPAVRSDPNKEPGAVRAQLRFVDHATAVASRRRFHPGRRRSSRRCWTMAAWDAFIVDGSSILTGFTNTSRSAANCRMRVRRV